MIAIIFTLLVSNTWPCESTTAHATYIVSQIDENHYQLFVPDYQATSVLTTSKNKFSRKQHLLGNIQRTDRTWQAKVDGFDRVVNEYVECTPVNKPIPRPRTLYEIKKFQGWSDESIQALKDLEEKQRHEYWYNKENEK